MANERYGQYCPLAHALDLVGERWSLLIVRELLPGAVNYPTLLERLPGIGPDRLTCLLDTLEAGGLITRRLRASRTSSEPYVLTEKGRPLEPVILSLLLKRLPGIGSEQLTHLLNTLEAGGLITRQRANPRTSSAMYALTERGRGLEPAVRSLVRWGVETLGEPVAADVYSPYWALLPLCASFRPERAGQAEAEYEFHVGSDLFHLRIAGGTIVPRYGPSSSPTYRLHIDIDSFIALVRSELDIQDAVRTKTLRIEGSLRAFAESLEYFDLQPRAVSDAA